MKDTGIKHNGCHFLQCPCRGTSRSGITVSAVLSRKARPAFPPAVDFGSAFLSPKTELSKNPFLIQS